MLYIILCHQKTKRQQVASLKTKNKSKAEIFLQRKPKTKERKEENFQKDIRLCGLN